MNLRLPPLLGESEAFLEAVEAASRLAPLDKPALIIGERGTGKELFAARVHYLSSRWDGPFVKLNCAALSDELLDAELFGHVAGAFTGATRARQGRFEAADGGSIFLDELATMSARLQEKLLRLIEYGEFEPLGSSRTLRVSVRVIGATNIDLPRAVTAGRFRGDLLDRLSFDVITLPPLRARPEDILLLAEHFATSMTQEMEREAFGGFSPEAQAALLAHPWPGNVRELRNVVERAVYRHEGGIRPIRDLIFDPFESPYRPRMDDAASGAPNPQTPDYPYDFRAHVEAEEVRLLQRALGDHQHHQRRTAKALGLTYDQLRSLIRKYALTQSH